MVITYRMPRLSWWIMSHLRYQPWVGLPNILAGEFIVPELLQDAATPEALSAAVIELLNDRDRRSAIEQRFGEMAVALRQNAAVWAPGGRRPTTVTSRPEAMRAWLTREPMNPAPPMTIVFIGAP
jgi:lipid A disaccharide synthetase